MKIMILCLLMAIVSAKADPQANEDQIEILEATVKEFNKSVKNADSNRKKRVLLKIIDSENELISLYTRQSGKEPANGPSEKNALKHNKSLIETSIQFRKNFPLAEETDVVGLIEGKAYERDNDTLKAEELYRKIIGEGSPGKIATQNKVAASIALVELLQQKQLFSEIKKILENHEAEPSYPQYGTYLRLLSEAQAHLNDFEGSYQNLQKDLTHIKADNLQNELPDSIETFSIVMSLMINQNESKAFEWIDSAIPNLTVGSESSYLKRMILNLSIDDKKKMSLPLYEKYKARIKTADRVQLIDVIISQLSFGGENPRPAFQSAQNLLQDILNSKPEDLAVISTNKMNSLKEVLAKTEKAALNFYKSTKDGTALIYVYSAQLKIESKNEPLRAKFLSNLYELYLERKDMARAKNTLKLLSQIKGNEATVFKRTLELNQSEWEQQFPEAKIKLEPKKPGTIALEPKSAKGEHLKKWANDLNLAKKIRSIDLKYLQYSTYELFKACYLSGELKMADDLAIQLLVDSPESEPSVKSITLLLETYRLDQDRNSQNRIADKILSLKKAEELGKIAKKIKYENILIQQEDLMKSGSHEAAARKTDELAKLAIDEKNDLLVQSHFLAGVSLIELNRESDAIKQFESVMKSGNDSMTSKTITPLAIAQFRLADKSNDLDSTVAYGLNLIQLGQKDKNDAIIAIVNEQTFSKKVLFYSWMGTNSVKAREVRELLCSKNSKTSLNTECDSITQSENLKKKIDECSSIQSMITAASKIDSLFLIPMSYALKNCVNGLLVKKENSFSSIKISLLDDSITKAAASIKFVDEASTKLKDYFDPSLYPEALSVSARMNFELANKIEAFKMKGISGNDLQAVKTQQKQLAEPFRTSAESKIKAAFERASTLMIGATQMNKILAVMTKTAPEAYQSLTKNWKPAKPLTSMGETLKKAALNLPVNSAQIIQSNNLKWITYQYLSRMAGSQKDDVTKSATLAIGTTAFSLAGLETKALELLEDSFSLPVAKTYVLPYLEAAYSSLNQKKTKSACEVLGNEKSNSVADLCNWAR